jgi:hypothetical protein
MFRSIILFILSVVCGCETLRVTLREEHRLTVFRGWAAEEDIWALDGRGKSGMSFMICIPRQILFSLSNQEAWLGRVCNMYGGEERCIQSLSRES